MASTVCSTFTCFPKVPLELQKMVWEEAAADLPALSIQRFKAEITLTQPNPKTHSPVRPLLCFTPHEDFINLTSSHRGLLRACRESRKAAQQQIDCLLPINYLATDTVGTLLLRQALVPFNPSGHFCISGLGPAIQEATEGLGARNSSLLNFYSSYDLLDQIQGLEEARTSPIKNLTIALDPARKAYYEERPMLGWDANAFEFVCSRMPNLKKVSLLGEGVLNRRHHLEQHDVNRMHVSTDVIYVNGEKGPEPIVTWYSLWRRWRLQQNVFVTITRSRIHDLGLRLFHSVFMGTLTSVELVEIEALKRELELTLSAIKE